MIQICIVLMMQIGIGIETMATFLKTPAIFKRFLVFQLNLGKSVMLLGSFPLFQMAKCLKDNLSTLLLPLQCDYLDFGIKRSPNFYKCCPEIRYSSFYFKVMFINTF